MTRRALQAVRCGANARTDGKVVLQCGHCSFHALTTSSGIPRLAFVTARSSHSGYGHDMQLYRCMANEKCWLQYGHKNDPAVAASLFFVWPFCCFGRGFGLGLGTGEALGADAEEITVLEFAFA